ncbi:MAG: MFS transporter [Rhodobiaceae bacterium]|nr:MFS transporter [Rhodobiaceae bacterium]
MRSTIASVTALLISVFVLLVGNGLQNTLVSVRGNDAGFGALILGLMGSGYFVGMTIGCLAAPAVIRRAGHIRTFAACTAIATVTSLLHALILQPETWIALRIATGMLFAVLYAVIESWLNDKTTNEFRGRVLSIYLIINYGGTAVGQQGLVLPDPNGFLLFAICAIAVSLSAVPVSMTRSVSPPVPEALRIRPRWLYELSPAAFIGCFAVGLVNASFWTLGPVFIAQAGYPPATVANFMSTVIVGAVVAIWPVGFLSDRVDRRLVMLGSAAISLIASLALAAFATVSPIWLYTAGFLFGAATMPIYSLVISHANDHAGPGDVVAVATGMLLLYCVGAMIGPLLGSGAMGAFGPGGLFIYTAFIQLLLCGITALRLTQRAAPPIEDREAYMPMRPTTTAVVGLDPRAPADDETDAGAAI